MIGSESSIREFGFVTRRLLPFRLNSPGLFVLAMQRLSDHWADDHFLSR